MSPSSQRHVVVFGGSDRKPGDEAWDQAEMLGRGVAEAGWTLVTGGYGGIMEAASSGAASAKGEVVGVLCKLFGAVGNQYLSKRIVTPDLTTRLDALIKMGDAFVAMPGSTGTLAELAMVWELMNKRLAPRRPFFCIGPFWRPVISLFAEDPTHDPRFETTGLPDHKGDLIRIVETVSEVVNALKREWV